VIDIRSLEVFYWVAKLGGFGRAATKLNTTQPAVSARIAALESEYGVRLLSRDKGLRPALTPAGVALFDQARRMIALQAETVALLRRPDSQGGLVRIGVADTLVHILLPALLRRLRAAYPLVTPDVQTDVSEKLRDALRAGELDLAFTLGHSGQIGAHELPLCALALAWVAAPSLAIGASLTRATLADIPVLTYARNTQPYADLAAALTDPGLPAARIFPNGSLATIVRMALDGHGIAVIPHAVVRHELAAGALRALRCDIRVPDLSFVACWLDPGAGLPSLIAALAQEILAHNDSRSDAIQNDDLASGRA
jgi:DNA-binding transcriptional LysR family regulator